MRITISSHLHTLPIWKVRALWEREKKEPYRETKSLDFFLSLPLAWPFIEVGKKEKTFLFFLYLAHESNPHISRRKETI